MPGGLDVSSPPGIWEPPERRATPRAGRAAFRWPLPWSGRCRRPSTGTSSRRPRRRRRCRLTACLDRLVADADRRVECRTGGDAREDAFLLEEFAGTGDGVGGADGEAGGEDRGVVELGDEALVEVAEPVDQVVVARLGGDDLDVRLVFAQEAADAHQGAGGAEARHEVGDGGQVGEDLRAGGGVVGAGCCPGCRTGRASPSPGARRRAPWRRGRPCWSRLPPGRR